MASVYARGVESRQHILIDGDDLGRPAFEILGDGGGLTGV
jgi:hypothetical protein